MVFFGHRTKRDSTSSENLVAIAQFLVALATSESQFRALFFKKYSMAKHFATGSFIVTVPVSNAGLERFFSNLGYVKSVKRALLSPATS